MESYTPVPPGANLFDKPECPTHSNPCQGGSWSGHSSQQGATGGSPNRNLREAHPCKPKKDWILEELNLKGLEEWPKEEQEQARKLLVKWEHMFACSDLDLGKLSFIKHQID